MSTQIWHRHAWINRLQSALLMLLLLGIGSLAGALLFGSQGLWVALGACLLVLLVQPAAASTLTLRLYRASPIPPGTAPELWSLLRRIAERAKLPTLPTLHYLPSSVINAFTVGGGDRYAIALSDGLLRGLSAREIAGVLAHEVAHIAHGDLRVMGLADYVSRLTSLFSLLGQVLLLISLPALLLGEADVNWPALVLLALSPHIALLAQLGLSRVREFDADLGAAALTGDPQGLAGALARIDRAGRLWRGLLVPGWGNPEPSWLRSHPATEERIRRLLALEPENPASAAWPVVDRRAHVPPPVASPVASPVPRRTRWHLGGLWH